LNCTALQQLMAVMCGMEFKEAYKQLNKAQRQAVDTIEGPVMVVAGPGTGKTQILTLRIANILQKTQVNPGNILALTFTESGVASMRSRLTEMIGTPAYSVDINTFHGFCNEIIKSNPGEFPRIIGSNNITEVDQVNLIEEAIGTLPLKELRPFGDPMFYVRPILACLNDLKREGVSPKQFHNIITAELKSFEAIDDLYHEKGAHKGKMKGDYQKLQKQIAKNAELAKIYEWYQSKLQAAKLYDYSDMIMETLRELSDNENLLLQIQEQYQYFLVDEHQDTNNAQNKILELLANFHPNPNIFVVGDEKQAIFRFQGASLENFLYFKKLYPSAKLIVLEENYRSTQPILDAAHSLLAGEKPLNANVAHLKEKIGIYGFSKPDAEYFFLAEDIKNKIKAGVEPQEIAVLYRDNRDAAPVAEMLEKAGLPFAIESDQDLLADYDIRKVLLLLETIHTFGSDQKLLEALHIDFLGFEILDVFKIIESAHKEKISAYEIIKSKTQLKKAGVENPEAFLNFYKLLAGWATLAHNISLPELFEKIITESGFLKYIMKGQTLEKLDKLNGLFDEIKNLVEVHPTNGLPEFLQYLATLKTHNLLLKKSISSAVGQIRLMTAHRSKGQEFEYVYIINAHDGHWGNKRRPNHLTLPARVFSLTGRILDKGATEDDERRLFYVALTRAKKGAAVSYSKESLSGQDQLPCQFITEIKPELIITKDTELIEKNFAQKKEVIFAPRIQKGIDLKSKTFIGDLFKRNGLSVTALNNYLDCPWKYFYINLLRIPQAKTKHQMYGTAVHYTLKDFFDAYRTGKADKNFLLSRFEIYLKRQPLSEKEYDELLEKGNKTLTGYFDFYHGSWRTKTITELELRGIMLTSDVRITGKIDKIEMLGAGKEVNVVDYKTSKPKTRGEIEGSTKSSNGDIKRQLMFYNLLLNKYENGRKYTMVSGDIDFIEPDEKGKYKKESFIILSEEVDELVEIIKKTADEIINLKFWNRFCDDKDCEYCALRRMMA